MPEPFLGLKVSSHLLVHLSCDDISKTLALVEANGGKTITPKTQIQSDNAGYFALFIDSKGNRVGLWSEQI